MEALRNVCHRVNKQLACLFINILQYLFYIRYVIFFSDESVSIQIYNLFIACTEKRKQKAMNSEKTYGGPLNLLVMLPGSQQVHISPVAGLESSVFHFRKQSRLLLQVSPYKMRQRQTPLNSHLHKSIHVVNYSLCLIFFYSSYFCSRCRRFKRLNQIS